MSEAPDAWPDLSGRLVLIVEDEYYIAADLADMLQRQGATMLGPVPGCDEALALLRQRPQPHLAILDINLQGRSVFPVADELSRRGVPFIFVSGYDPAVVPRRFLQKPFWQKPIAEESVLQSLASLPSGAAGSVSDAG